MLDRLVDLLLQFVDLFKFWQVVDQYERGVVLRFGKFQRELEPGIHLLLPFNIDNALLDNVVTRTYMTRTLTLTLGDNTNVTCGVLVRYNIRDIRKALLEVERIDDVIHDCVFGNVSSMIRSVTWESLPSPEFGETLSKSCRRQAFRYGVEIESVVFTDLCKAKPLALIRI
jgi:regulator of protease activity HflC (stomatin/prohibitin superfamily)